MTVINAVGNSLTGFTGTGKFVGATAPTVSGLISDTIKLISANGILDSNGNIALAINATGSANYLIVANAAASSAPSLSASGSDTNIPLYFGPKGNSGVVFFTAAPTQPVGIVSGTSFQHSTTFAFFDTAASRTVTFLDADMTLVGTAANLSNGQIPIGNTNNLPTAATITAGTGISVTNGAGSITLAAITTGGVRSFQIFTTGSALTYTKPANVSSILVELWGGGGGGGGVTATASSNSAAGGGGAGGYARLYVASAASTYTYTVGGGGNGGVAGTNTGSTGATTTFSASSLQATGGVGGIGSAGGLATVATVALGGLGGVGTNGNVNANGATGERGLQILTIATSGAGASSPIGGGGQSVTSAATGNNASVYASGGSGAMTGATTNRAGGNGSGGLIIVWEFS